MPRSLLRITGFAVFLSVLFLNAFVDLGHKIIIQNTVFKMYDGQDQIILTAIVNALILLPFILLFTPSGYVSDKYPKNKVMRISAWAALLITIMITVSYYQGLFWLSFSLTFLLAIQSAMYSPSKYGCIREIVGEQHLAEGNGMVQAITMVSILLSTFLFSILFERLLPEIAITDKSTLLQQIAPLGWVLIGLTTLELILAYRLPQKTDTDEAMLFDWKKYRSGKTQREVLSVVKNNRFIWLSIIGLSVFWAVAQVILAAYPAFAKEHLGVTRVDLLQGLLACTGIGIMVGSIWAGRVSKDHIESGLIPVGAVGLAVAISLITMFHSPYLQALNFIFLGIMGGFFVVPLNAYMQYHAKEKELGRVIAAYNLIHNGAMLAFLILTALLAAQGINSVNLFFLMSLVVIGGSIYTIAMLPQSLLRFTISALFRARYNIHVLGFDKLPAAGGVLLLGNHISWVDWALVQIAAPRSIHFVMERSYYERWYLRWFFKMFGVVPISSGDSAASIETINELLRNGKAVCLFPEGTISRTGQLAIFRRGYEKAVKGSGAVIVPFYLHGLWGSRFSRSSEFLKENRQSGFKRDIIVAFGEPLPENTVADQLKRRVFDLTVTSWKSYSEDLPSVPVQWLQVAKRRGSKMASTDIKGEPLSHYKFITAVFRFARMIKKRSPEQNIGLLLPTTTGGAIINMAVLSLGKTVVNLNYTASQEALRAAVKKADIKTIYTSSRFVKKLNDRGIDIDETFADIQIVQLEEIKKRISKFGMFSTMLLVVTLPTRLLQGLYIKSAGKNAGKNNAAILFSSGSEGEPKGIELTHQNLSANARQVANMLNTQEDDVMMSTLPTYHAFGLLASTLMPLCEGIPIVCHPDPADVVNIAKGITRHHGTIMLGTSTFLRLYVCHKQVHPLMLESLRLVVAGAEKLNPDIREAFKIKFGKSILEGYGTTETSPVASVNVPDELDTTYWRVQLGNIPGSVGMPLPGTSFRIVDPVTLEELPTGEDGLIIISGPQVMKSYLNAPQKTADAIVNIEDQRWYKTGDKGHLNEDGFLFIIDRYSRFAKLDGEMISLTAVEEQVRKALADPELECVAVNTPDTKKGEKITLLVTTHVDGNAIKQKLLDIGTHPLMIPQSYIEVAEIPRLGSGKSDFSAAKKWLLAQ